MHEVPQWGICLTYNVSTMQVQFSIVDVDWPHPFNACWLWFWLWLALARADTLSPFSYPAQAPFPLSTFPFDLTIRNKQGGYSSPAHWAPVIAEHKAPPKARHSTTHPGGYGFNVDVHVDRRWQGQQRRQQWIRQRQLLRIRQQRTDYCQRSSVRCTNRERNMMLLTAGFFSFPRYMSPKESVLC